MGMVRYTREPGRCDFAREEYGGVSFLCGTLYVPGGLPERKISRRIRKLERGFLRNGVSCVLLPEGFPYGSGVSLRRPDELAFWHGIAHRVVLSWLESRGIAPGRACVCLRDVHLSGALRGTAQKLINSVRLLQIDVPGGAGEAYAAQLRREYGLPVLPPGERAGLTVSFCHDDQAQLVFSADAVCCGGLRISVPDLAFPEGFERCMPAALWQLGRLKPEDVRISCR